MAFKGTHNVASHGSKIWKQTLKVGYNQKVVAGTLMVLNSKTIKPGENTYIGNNNIHAKVNGVVEIKNKIISVLPNK